MVRKEEEGEREGEGGKYFSSSQHSFPSIHRFEGFSSLYSSRRSCIDGDNGGGEREGEGKTGVVPRQEKSFVILRVMLTPTVRRVTGEADGEALCEWDRDGETEGVAEREREGERESEVDREDESDGEREGDTEVDEVGDQWLRQLELP